MKRITMTCLSCLAAAVVTKSVSVSSFVVQVAPVARQCVRVMPSSSRFSALSSTSTTQLLSASASTSFSSFLSSPNRRPLSTSLAATSAETTETEPPSSAAGQAVPITLLSGFLGSGKTTTLQHLLENRDGLRIGVIVNDMASVNIDAKLVKNSDSSSGMNIKDNNNGVVELQNGCACCSLADELLTTVETLLDSRTGSSSGDDDNDNGFDAVVVELSGVADPLAIQQNWKTAKLMGHPVTRKADMKRIVTLIDSSTFGTDWMTWDVAGERDGWVDPNDDCAAGRKVPELLAEQIESADVLLLNKIDLAGPEQVQVAAALARTINSKAILEEVEFGKVTSPKQIIREDKLEEVVEEEESKCADPGCDDDSHSHAHSHSHDDKSACTDSDCADPACDEHGDATNASCSEPGCTDDSHDHSHSHSDSSEAADASCSDPDCTDDSHEHSHSHSHAKSTSTDNLGIVNFVYKSDRPFETRNLMSLLNTWPVPIKEDLAGLEQFTSNTDAESQEDIGRDSPFFGVLRSKGFCWLAPTKWQASGTGGDQWRHDTAMYWSHAGKHFGISTAGKWWATLDNKKMKDYFNDDIVEYERIQSEDFVSQQWGDRRQEIVFIGVGIDQEKITTALDNCLLGEVGMERYSQELNNYMNTILTAPAKSASGLFDVGNYDNMDVQ